MTADQRFRLLMDEAKDRVLYVSPPYADARCSQAFLSGYERALRDISKGWLKVALDEDQS